MLLDFLLPAPCVICGKLPRPLCEMCQFCPQSQLECFLGLPLTHCGNLTGDLEKVITSYKDKQRLKLGGFLSGLLDHSVSLIKEAVQFDCFVTPPRNLANYKKRGFHPIDLLARKAEALRYPRVMARSARRTSDQRPLGLSERRANLSGAFSLAPGKARLLLVDDVLTTGSTIRELARAAEAAGYQVVGTCVIARRKREQF